jgi:DNA-binding CsgD family transcriptional regulator
MAQHIKRKGHKLIAWGDRVFASRRAAARFLANELHHRISAIEPCLAKHDDDIDAALAYYRQREHIHGNKRLFSRMALARYLSRQTGQRSETIEHRLARGQEAALAATPGNQQIAKGKATRAQIIALSSAGEEIRAIAANLELAHEHVRRVLQAEGRIPPPKTRIPKEITRAQVLQLDDAGLTRQEIAAELALAYETVGYILREAGRGTPRDNRKSSRAIKARIEREYARTAPMIERAAAMEARGASLAEIGETIGLTPSGAHKLLQRAREDGRLSASELRPRQQAATLIREKQAAALADAGHTRTEIATALGITINSVRRLVRRTGRRVGRREPLSAEAERHRLIWAWCR